MTNVVGDDIQEEQVSLAYERSSFSSRRSGKVIKWVVYPQFEELLSVQVVVE